MKQLQSTARAALATSRFRTSKMSFRTPLMSISVIGAAFSSAIGSAALAYPSIGLEFDLAPASSLESQTAASSAEQSSNSNSNSSTQSSAGQTVQAPSHKAAAASATASSTTNENIPQFSEPTYQPEFPISPERLPVPDHAGDPPLASADSQTFAAVPPTPPYLEPSWLFAQQLSPASPAASPDSSASDQTQPSDADTRSDVAADNASEPDTAPNTASSDSEKSSLPALGSRPNIGFEIGQNQQVTIAAVPADVMAQAAIKSSDSKEQAADSSSHSSNQTASEANPSQTPEPLPAKDLDAVAKDGVNPDSGNETQSISRVDHLFTGKADSLVARAIGHAEGTRTATGERTPAYYGHNDPGNGKWNLGSFSYQHGASSPEVADELQLQRLKGQYQTLQQQAQQFNLDLSLAEDLNGLDLANQSPRAALADVGYLARLAEAQAMGLRGSDAILWARTRAFLDPDTQQWNAPGLGNTLEGISRDQERRMNAIQRVLEISPASAPVHPVIVNPDGSATPDQPAAPSATQAPNSPTSPSEKSPSEKSPSDTALRPTSTAQPPAEAQAQPHPQRDLPRLSATNAPAASPDQLMALLADTHPESRSHIHSHIRSRADVIDRIFAFNAPVG